MGEREQPSKQLTPSADGMTRLAADIRWYADMVQFGDSYSPLRETYGLWAAAVDALVSQLQEAQRGAPLIHHRCSGCGHRWEGSLRGAELCGDCWRRGQAAIFSGAPSQQAEMLVKLEALPKFWHSNCGMMPEVPTHPDDAATEKWVRWEDVREALALLRETQG